jgi:hypothetical protein
MNVRTALKEYLERFYPLLSPTAVFLVTAVALASPIPAIRELAAGIFTENLAPRSFWTTLSLTCFAFSGLLLLTKNRLRRGPSRAWEALVAPRVQIQGWLITIGGMSAGLGLFSVLLAFLDRSFAIALVAIGALAIADLTVRILEWMEPLEAHVNADYDPNIAAQRKQRWWMIGGVLTLGFFAAVAALSVDNSEPCSHSCDSAPEGKSPIPATHPLSLPRG